MFELPVGDIRPPLKVIEIEEGQATFIYKAHYERTTAEFLLNFILEHESLDFNESDFNYALNCFIEKDVFFQLISEQIYELYAPEYAGDLNVEFYFDAAFNRIEFKRIGDKDCGCNV